MPKGRVIPWPTAPRQPKPKVPPPPRFSSALATPAGSVPEEPAMSGATAGKAAGVAVQKERNAF